MMCQCFHSCAPYQRQGHGSFRIHQQFRASPLSYALLAISCLTPNPLDRPNFWQLVGVLEDLRCYLISQVICETSAAHATLSTFGTPPTCSGSSNLHQLINANAVGPDGDSVTTSMRSMCELSSRTDIAPLHAPGLLSAVAAQAGDVCFWQ
jgi:hypothetical protein